MSDPLREALERIAGQGYPVYDHETAQQVGACLDQDGRRLPWLHWAEIAREALAIETEYEYRAVSVRADRTTHDEDHYNHVDHAKSRALKYCEWWPDYESVVERRVKPGPWERVQ